MALLLQTSSGHLYEMAGCPKLRFMDSNTTDHEDFGTDSQLSRPHFDEEATLLSARPVIPLNEVAAKARSGKRLAFGLAIGSAFLVGALGTTFIFRQRSQKQGTPVAGANTTVAHQTAPEGPSLAEDPRSKRDSAGSASGMAENGGELSSQEVNSSGQDRKQGSQVLQRDESNMAHENSHDEFNNLKDQRRAERMEATRLRRKAEREARRDAREHRSQPSDDLLRIREIFEGTPRP